MIPLIRLRRWALWSAAAWALGGLAHPALAPCAALLWTALGCVALRRTDGVARRQRPILHRLFFAWSGANVLWFTWGRLPEAGGAARYAALLGAGCLCGVLMERLMALLIPRKFSWPLGAAGILLAAALYRL